VTIRSSGRGGTVEQILELPQNSNQVAGFEMEFSFEGKAAKERTNIEQNN
jgi:hypothetical protein